MTADACTDEKDVLLHMATILTTTAEKDDAQDAPLWKHDCALPGSAQGSAGMMTTLVYQHVRR